VLNPVVSQLLLFPDPRPLVERFGSDFFRQLPQTAGVYLMKDARETVLYVGKAKNLRKRLCSYRVANPDRMRKRQLKLLRSATRIELEECADEQTALTRESELLLRLKPRFNRAGTWPRQAKFIQWKVIDSGLAFMISENKPADAGFVIWKPSGAAFLLPALVRLAWTAIHNKAGYCQMPLGYWPFLFRTEVTVPKLSASRKLITETAFQLQAACDGKLLQFSDWLKERTANIVHPFENAAKTLDLETLGLKPEER